MPFQVLLNALLSAFEKALFQGFKEMTDHFEASMDSLSEVVDEVCGGVKEQLHGLREDLDNLVEAAKEYEQQVQSLSCFFVFPFTKVTCA
jgi:hypothetical protein